VLIVMRGLPFSNRALSSRSGLVVCRVMNARALTGLVMTGLLTTALAACVATANVPPPRGILVSGPPPAVIREERPAPPATTGNAPSAWVGGYWHWTGIQYAWIPGHWEVAPPVGAAWRAPAYVQNNGAYFYEPGGWGPTRAPGVSPGAPPVPAPGAGGRPVVPANAEAFH
jgi:hypothetical protein